VGTATADETVSADEVAAVAATGCALELDEAAAAVEDDAGAPAPEEDGPAPEEELQAFAV
jgi:hypothetical protein